MLRNNFKSTFYRLAFLFGVILSACSDTRSLFSSETSNSFSQSKTHLNIKAEPYEKYRLEGIISRQLPVYISDIANYKIQIEIKSYTSSAVYTERQVTKEQLRMAAKITISNKDGYQISEQVVDVFSTYEVCDDLPFSVLSSKKQAKNAVLDELAHSIILSITASIKSYTR